MTKRPPLDWFVSSSRYLMVVGVFGLLMGALEACAWSAINAYHVIQALVRGDPYAAGVIGLLHMLDAFLVAAVLLIVAIGTYGLFVAPLADTPEELVAKSLHALKVRFASALILLMTVTFVEHLLSWVDPWMTLVFAVAITIVSLLLIAYSRWSEH